MNIDILFTDVDGSKDKAMGEQEDRRVHRRGGTDVDGLHMSEGYGQQRATEHTQRRRNGRGHLLLYFVFQCYMFSFLLTTLR